MLLFSTKKKKPKTNGKTLKQFELRKSESWPKIHEGKTKYMTNHADSEDTLTDQEKFEKVTNSNTSDKPHTSKTLQEKIFLAGSEQCGAFFLGGGGGNKEILQDRQLPPSLKK